MGRVEKENVKYHYIEYSLTVDHTKGKSYEVTKQFRSILEKDTVQFIQFEEREHKIMFSAIAVWLCMFPVETQFAVEFIRAVLEFSDILKFNKVIVKNH